MSDATYYAQVIDGIVTAVRVVSYDFIVANPDRYGDANNWKQTFFDVEGVTYAGIGFIYDAVTDTFTPPPTPESETPDGNA
jgi:hypothetical protein